MVRRFCSVLLIFLLFVLAVSSAGAEVLFGAKKGIAVTTMYNYPMPDQDWSYEAMPNFSGGFFFGFSLSPLFSLQAELLYCRRGIEGEASGMGWSYMSSYIDLPVLAKFNLSLLNGWLRTSFYGGTQVSFALNHAFKMDVSNGPPDFPRSGLYPFDWGLLIGAEAGVQIKAYYLFLDVRYSLDFLSVLKPEYSFGGEEPRYTYFSFLLGYGVRI